MKLTSRERVLRTLNGKSVDRVPIDFGGGNCANIVCGSKNKIKEGPPWGILALYEYCGIEDYEEPVEAPYLNYVLNVDERLILRCGSDIRHVYSGGWPAKKILPDGTVVDAFGVTFKKTGFYGSAVDKIAPMKNLTTAKEIEEFIFPDPESPDLVRLANQVKERCETTDYALNLEAGYLGSTWQVAHLLRGFEQCFIDMRLNKKLWFTLMEKLTELQIASLNKVLPIVGPYVDIIACSDDLGMQTQPMMSVDTFRKCLKPWLKRRFQEIKRLAPHAKIQLHSCGSVFDFVPDLIDCGVDILNPIQPLAYKMEAWRLKREYGDRICFHGGIDIQRLLNFGTPQDIKNRVKEIIAIFEGCRYILAASHNIEPETHPENIMALFDAVREYYEGN